MKIIRLATFTTLAILLAALSSIAQRPQQPVPSDEAILARAPEGVTVKTNLPYRDGHKRWVLDLAMPTKPGNDPLPGLVFVHGGGWRNGDKRTSKFLDPALKYAAKGYVCITVNYRLTNSAPFPACVEDVKNAVRWFRAHAEKYHLDPDRIGAYGNSAGAHLVSMLGLAGPDAKLEGDGPYHDQSSLVQAVCASATPTDFLHWGKGISRGLGRPGSLLEGPEDSLEERAKAASPITYVHQDAPPFLLVHSADDRTVPINQGDDFAKALKDAGADVTYLRYEDGGHGSFTRHANETVPAMEKFFARVLKRE